MNQFNVSEIINRLFLELVGIFPAFKQAWPTQEEYKSAKRNWVKAIKASGINKIEMLQWGLMRCRESESNFVITPGQFVKWCYPKPEYLGFPNIEDAYKIALLVNRGEELDISISSYTKQIILHILHAIGSFEFRTMKEETSRKRFIKFYETYCHKFYEGKLNLNHQALENKFYCKHSNKDIVKPEFINIKNREEALQAIRDMGIPIKNPAKPRIKFCRAKS